MATVKYENATRIYPGNDAPSVDRLNIDIEDGEFLVVVGPSGCGKSTACACSRVWRRSTRARSGSVTDVTNLSPKDRDVAMVFQNYALYRT